MILGIDIGGANTKAASADGRFVHSTYLPLWRECDLEGGLKEIKDKAGKVSRIGVTITGELADCYSSKKEGIEHIASAVRKVFPDALFFGSDGRFHSDTSDHRLFSAANWMASALFVGSVHKDVLFVDVGSTTSDVIPVRDGKPLAGMTDFERLSKGELVYAGALRTNVATLLKKVSLRCSGVRTSSELFSVTGDVYRLLGRIDEKDYACDTPDGAGKDALSCARRLARVVCCDLEELSAEEIKEIASQAWKAQTDDLSEAINHTASRYGIKKAAVCGLGGFIAKDALLNMSMPFTMLPAEYGESVSRVFPAYATARLLENYGE